MNELKAIEFKEVTKYYGKVLALDNVSFEIPLNSRFALLGPNGAGKTTTLKLIAGLLRPNQGYIKIMGYEPETTEAKRLLEDSVRRGLKNWLITNGYVVNQLEPKIIDNIEFDLYIDAIKGNRRFQK